MSLFDQFDTLRSSVDALMGNFDAGLGSGRRGRRRTRMYDPFGTDIGGLGGLDDFGFGFGGSPWDMGVQPLLMSGTMNAPAWGGAGTDITGGGVKGADESKMEDTGAAGTALTTTGGGESRLGQQRGVGGLPVLRCRVNIADRKDSYEVSAEVPGFDKENLKVNISDDNVLTIAGEQKREHVDEAKDKSYIRTERSFGSVQRSLRLPKNVDKSQVNASYLNGILHINVPKAKPEEKATQQVQIA